MEIYFLRHGDYQKKPGMKDAECPLSEQGLSQMEREAISIAGLGLRLDLIITSPLVRARQTAEIIARPLRLPNAPLADDRLAPGFDAGALARILQEHAAATAIMLVGHEPDFSRTISACTGGGRVECRKGSLARVDIGKPSPLEGVLAWLLPPDVLAPRI